MSKYNNETSVTAIIDDNNVILSSIPKELVKKLIYPEISYDVCSNQLTFDFNGFNIHKIKNIILACDDTKPPKFLQSYLLRRNQYYSIYAVYSNEDKIKPYGYTLTYKGRKYS